MIRQIGFVVAPYNWLQGMENSYDAAHAEWLHGHFFKHALDAELIDRPVRFGPGFTRPSQKTMRLHRAQQGPKLFTADEVRRLLGAAGALERMPLLVGRNPRRLRLSRATAVVRASAPRRDTTGRARSSRA